MPPYVFTAEVGDILTDGTNFAKVISLNFDHTGEFAVTGNLTKWHPTKLEAFKDDTVAQTINNYVINYYELSPVAHSFT